MKPAIQGHLSRGHEVIQILKDLGGKTREELTGRRLSQYYFINCNGDIDLNLRINLLNHKLYTLEEFEKEFPFKVGDIVLLKGTNKPYEIIALELYMDKLCYKLDNGLHYDPNTLTTYKEMKEERNITLTLDKAKEWYKKGGELKEIALQAFTEKELNSLPRSWKEFCERYSKTEKEAYIGVLSEIYSFMGTKRDRNIYSDRNICPSQKSAEAHLAMIQLEQLRNCWWNGWEPEWNNCEKYIIKWDKNDLTVFTAGRIHAFLVFPTKEMAEEFLECFKDLIEKAADLI